MYICEISDYYDKYKYNSFKKIYILKKTNKDKEKIKQFPALKNNVEKLINLIKKNKAK